MGIILVFLGLLLGWPAVTLLGVLAAALQDSWFIAWAAPAIYAVSWLIYLAGFVVGGPEALRYVGDFNRWLARVIVTWLVGSEAAQRCISESRRDRDSTESQPRRSGTRPDEPG